MQKEGNLIAHYLIYKTVSPRGDFEQRGVKRCLLAIVRMEVKLRRRNTTVCKGDWAGN
jgi:hypothetical protein